MHPILADLTLPAHHVARALDFAARTRSGRFRVEKAEKAGGVNETLTLGMEQGWWKEIECHKHKGWWKFEWKIEQPRPLWFIRKWRRGEITDEELVLAARVAEGIPVDGEASMLSKMEAAGILFQKGDRWAVLPKRKRPVPVVERLTFSTRWLEEVNRDGIRMRQAMLYLLLRQMQEKHGVCIVSWQEVARKMGIHPVTARYHLNVLIEKGWVKRVKNGVYACLK